MSNLIISSDLTELPLLDTELLYVNPPYLLNPDNYDAITKSVTEEILHQIRFGYYVGLGCTYPRFDLDSFFYKMKTNPVYQELPDKNPKHMDFDLITNSRAIKLRQVAEKYERVYLFWSGGIDSTLVLCAILKNWAPPELNKLTVVLNDFSIAEHPEFFRKFIQNKLLVANSDEFYSGVIKLNSRSLYLTGDLGDPIFGYGPIYEFDKKYPGLYKQPWKKNIEKLIEYFSVAGPESGIFAMNHIMESLDRSQVEVDTVYDLLWWLDFNWGYDFDLYYLLWLFPASGGEIHPKKFMEENVFLFFNSKEYQNWAMTTINTNLKIGDTVNTHKISAKTYIYEFDRDSDYFTSKLKVSSISMTPGWYTSKRIFAIDTSYNLYYVEPSIWLSK